MCQLQASGKGTAERSFYPDWGYTAREIKGLDKLASPGIVTCTRNRKRMREVAEHIGGYRQRGQVVHWSYTGPVQVPKRENICTDWRDSIQGFGDMVYGWIC